MLMDVRLAAAKGARYLFVPLRFMDTSSIECDVQPNYVRVTIKGKVSHASRLFTGRPDVERSAVLAAWLHG